MLRLDAISAGYGATQVLFDVSLSVGRGEVLAVLGRNGMGKTTTVSAIMGLLPCWGGTMAFGGQPITGLPPYRVAQRGLGLVPEGRQIFPTLSVEENLVATASRRGAAAPRWTGCGRCSPGCGSGAATPATACPAASSRCWPSGGR